MTAETDIAAVDDGGANSAAEVRTALTSVLSRAQLVAVDRVDTSESTTSTSYTDLTTTGPSVSVSVTATGILIVHIGATMSRSAGNNPSFMSFALSGGNTLAANDNRSVFVFPNSTGIPYSLGRTFVLTGLSAGSTTVTAKYRAGSGVTAVFDDRELSTQVGIGAA